MGDGRSQSKGGAVVEDGALASALALEPRFMFDAAGLVSGADLAEQQAAEEASAGVGEDAAGDEAAALGEHELLGAMAAFELPVDTVSYVFIDGTVENYQELLGAVPGDAEIVVIHPDTNGLQIIADTLQGQKGIESLHIISPGESGSVSLGGLTLSQDNLGDYAALLGEIGEALSAEGDILFYGSSIGEGDLGEDFTKSLAELTGADVAVSTDPTGAAELGGDWDLELRIGKADAAAISSSEFAALLDPALPGDPGDKGIPAPPPGGGSTDGGSTGGGGTAGGGGTDGGPSDAPSAPAAQAAPFFAGIGTDLEDERGDRPDFPTLPTNIDGEDGGVLPASPISSAQGPSVELQQLVNQLGGPSLPYQAMDADTEATNESGAGNASMAPRQEPSGEMDEPGLGPEGYGGMGFSQQLAEASGQSDQFMRQLEEAIAGVFRKS